MILVVLMCLATYFIPTIVASRRQHRSAAAVFFLNLLLGWTLLGWVAALVWSLSDTALPTVVINQSMPVNAVHSDDMKTCPQCAEEVRPQAIICRYCGYAFNDVSREARLPG